MIILALKYLFQYVIMIILKELISCCNCEEMVFWRFNVFVFLKFQSFLLKVLTFSSASMMRSMLLTTFDNLACITFIRNFISFHQKCSSLYLFYPMFFFLDVFHPKLFLFICSLFSDGVFFVHVFYTMMLFLCVCS